MGSEGTFATWKDCCVNRDVKFPFPGLQTLVFVCCLFWPVVVLHVIPAGDCATYFDLFLRYLLIYLPVTVVVVVVVDRFYIALFSALEQTYCARM